MKNLFGLLMFVLVALVPRAHAATCSTISGGASQATIQAALTSCGSGNTVALSAGSYATSSSLNVPCGVSVIGPAVWPNTAVITTSNAAANIFSYATGGCTAPMSIQWTWGVNASLMYIPGNTGTYSNMTFEHNTSTNLPSSDWCPTGPSSCGSNPYYFTGAIFFNGTQATVLSNITIEYNSFGDSNSCSAIMNIGVDQQGLCAAVFINQGQTTNILFKYNKVFHMENGFKMTQVGFSVGAPIAQSDNVDIEYNYFLNIHRAEVENQQGVINHPMIVSNNIFQDQYYTFYGSIGVSTPCCQFMNTDGTATSVNPALIVNNNVNIQSATTAGAPCPGAVFGYEWWGQGTQGNNNLIHSNILGHCPGFEGGGFLWGYGAGAWSISHSILQGLFMSQTQSVCGGTANPYTGTAYIITEECQGNPPTQVGNVLGATPIVVTSVAPTLSPGSGSFSGSQIVTMTDAGNTSGAGPLGNTSIYYTTDGTTPVPGSGTTQLYTGPITLTSTTTVRAVGFYGTGYTPGAGPVPYPYTYPSGFGYVPSSVVSANYNGGGTPTAAAPVLTPGSSSFNPSVTVTVTDSTPASTIYCTTDGTTPTTGSPVYTGPFTFTATTQLQCIAAAAGYLNSIEGIGNYTLNAPPLTGCSQGNAGSVNTLNVGGLGVQQIGFCTYSSVPVTDQCYPTKDTYGNTITLFGTTNGAILGVTTGGLATGVSPGFASVTATGTGSLACSTWGFTVSGAPPASPTFNCSGGCTIKGKFTITP